MTHRNPTTENLLLLVLQGVRHHLPPDALAFVDSRTRYCSGCGIPFFWTRLDHTHCSHACAIAAWRAANPHKMRVHSEKFKSKRRAAAKAADEGAKSI